MAWKKQLEKLEQLKEWDLAIEFLQKIIENNPNNLDAYLSLNYLLMNLLVEEEHGPHFKHDYYADLLKEYFDKSYEEFFNNPEYLFYTGLTAVMSEWYFGMNIEEIKPMLQKAASLSPDHILYQYANYVYSNSTDICTQKKAYEYAHLVIQEQSPIKKALFEKGFLGKYVFMIMQGWSEDFLKDITNIPNVK